MELQRAHAILKRLEGVGGSNSKIAILEEYRKSKSLQILLEFSANPYKPFHVQQLPPATTSRCPQPDAYKRFVELLVKLNTREITGHNARFKINEVFIGATEEEEEVMRRILKKDLRCGVGLETLLKVWPDLCPNFLISKAKAWKDGKKNIKFPCYSQIKLDGARIFVLKVAEREGIAYSSEGNVVWSFPEIVKQAITILETGEVLDGEMCHPNGYEAVMTRWRMKTEREDTAKELDCYIQSFDIFPRACFEGYIHHVTQRERMIDLFDRLKADPQPNIKFTPIKICKNWDDIDAHFQYALDKGYEGIIVKNPESPYKHGKKDHWTKRKPEESIDLEVVGFEPGKEGKQYANTLGTITCRRPWDNKAGYVDIDVPPTGKNLMAVCNEIWNNKDKYLGKVCEVKYDRDTPDGSIRFPKFVRWRADKTVGQKKGS